MKNYHTQSSSCQVAAKSPAFRKFFLGGFIIDGNEMRGLRVLEYWALRHAFRVRPTWATPGLPSMAAWHTAHCQDDTAFTPFSAEKQQGDETLYM
jgi:hypothetical protein